MVCGMSRSGIKTAETVTWQLIYSLENLYARLIVKEQCMSHSPLPESVHVCGAGKSEVAEEGIARLFIAGQPRGQQYDTVTAKQGKQGLGAAKHARSYRDLQGPYASAGCRGHSLHYDGRSSINSSRCLQQTTNGRLGTRRVDLAGLVPVLVSSSFLLIHPSLFPLHFSVSIYLFSS